MNCSDFYPHMLAAAATIEAIDPGSGSPEARCALLAIAGQESGWHDIRQIGGPARGPWQFEITGVRGLTYSSRYMPLLTRACGVGIRPIDIYDALIGNLPLAYGCARELLRSVRGPLPAIGDSAETLRQYRWAWRPGAWNDPVRAAEAQARFAVVYPQAVAAVRA